RDSRLIIVSSLAKAFGVPVAMLGGAQDMIATFEHRSATRTHCSPPSAAVIASAGHALSVNKNCGDTLRLRLAQRVTHLRRRMRLLNLVERGGLFPMQVVSLPDGVNAGALHEALLKRGVQTVLHRKENGTGARISFVITARHTFNEIDRAMDRLADEVIHLQFKRSKGGNGDDNATTGTSGAFRSIFRGSRRDGMGVGPRAL